MAASLSVARILVVVDDSPECAVALRSVMRMAERSRATVEALFIEDTTVLHLASLTVVRHVHRHGGPAAPLDATTIESMYRSQRLGAQRTVSAVARPSGAGCDLRVLRGSVGDALLKASGEADIVVLALPSFGLHRLAGIARKLGGTGVQALLLLRSTLEPRSVLVMHGGASEANVRLNGIADWTARSLELPLQLVWDRSDEIRDRGTGIGAGDSAERISTTVDNLDAPWELSTSTLVACGIEAISERLAPYAGIIDARCCPLLISF